MLLGVQGDALYLDLLSGNLQCGSVVVCMWSARHAAGELRLRLRDQESGHSRVMPGQRTKSFPRTICAITSPPTIAMTMIHCRRLMDAFTYIHHRMSVMHATLLLWRDWTNPLVYQRNSNDQPKWPKPSSVAIATSRVRI
jgi:hypothetical protein